MKCLSSGIALSPPRFSLVLSLVLLFFSSLSLGAPELVSAEIQEILKAGKHPKLRWGNFSDVSKTLAVLYAPGSAPVWSRDGVPSAQAKAILEVLASADDVGLSTLDYDVSLLSEWLKPSLLKAATPSEWAAFDVAMSVAVSRYASNVTLGRINPKSVGFALDVDAKRPQVLKVVRELPQASNPKVLLAGLEPDFPIYKPLKEALLRYRRLAVEIPKVRFAFPAKFTPGMSHPDVPALRKLLIALGDYEASSQGGDVSQVYDPALVAAVKAFQIRHGIGDDGVIGKGTLSRLVVPVPDRLKQIQLGLERLRWLPASVKGLYLIVNIPAFKLYGARAGEGLGQHELQMNVVVGEAIDGRNTPVFHSDMTMVTFRPYWNVPEAIAAKEIVPELLRRPGYLAKNNMEIVSGFAQSAQALEPTHDVIERLATGGLKVRQKPGPENALGLYKFSFPNTNNVYLHSTPSKGLFNRDRRDFSHGCIRVQDPLGLAQWVLEDNGDWDRERIESFANGEVTKTITLKRAIPVYILYSTVMADQQGRISFYEDIYGHDRTLQVLLARGFPYPT